MADANNMASSAVDPTTLDLYKLCVEMADRTSARRLATNTFFVTLQSALAALIGILGTVHKPGGIKFDVTSLLTLAIVGIILSLSWWALLRYYRRLNTAKFSVINNMESGFPVKPFTDEWQILHPAGEPGAHSALKWYQLRKRARQQSHREATVVEQIVPILFGAIYVILGIGAFIT
jgi:hypothetical protein